MNDFSRLNFKNTVLSKRKLNLLVDSKVVDGWDDPRFPTIRGITRRGVIKEALIDFIQEQGHSKNTTLQEWDKLFAINKKYLDPIVPRYSGIMSESAVEVVVSNQPEDVVSKIEPLHPKNVDLGTKEIIFSNKILVESEDFNTCEVGEKITLMHWGNAIVTAKEPKPTVELVLTDKDFKKTKKINWIANHPSNLKVDIVEYDHILTQADAVEFAGEFMDIVNKNSKFI